MSQENVEIVRRLYAHLGAGGSAQEFDERITDDALSAFLDPGVEWITVPESLLAVDRYVGFDGVRRFWDEFVSAWEDYRVEPLTLRDAGDQVAVVVHIVGRTHGAEVDGTRSSLLTVRDGKVVRVQAFADPDAALEAAGLSEWAISQENVDLVRGGFDVFQEGNLSRMLDLMADDLVTYRADPDGATYHGREGFLRATADWTEDFSGWSVIPKEFIDAGDRALVPVRQVARGDASGIPVEGNFWFVFEMRARTVAKVSFYIRRAEALEAAGLEE